MTSSVAIGLLLITQCQNVLRNQPPLPLVQLDVNLERTAEPREGYHRTKMGSRDSGTIEPETKRTNEPKNCERMNCVARYESNGALSVVKLSWGVLDGVDWDGSGGYTRTEELGSVAKKAAPRSASFTQKHRAVLAYINAYTFSAFETLRIHHEALPWGIYGDFRRENA